MKQTWSKDGVCKSCGKRISGPPALGCEEDRHAILYSNHMSSGISVKGMPSNIMQCVTGSCWMCHREMGKNMCIDHDHNTQRFRGLICKRCNTILGFMESVGITPKMIQDYLEGKLDAILFRLPIRS